MELESTIARIGTRKSQIYLNLFPHVRGIIQPAKLSPWAAGLLQSVPAGRVAESGNQLQNDTLEKGGVGGIWQDGEESPPGWTCALEERGKEV